jgi:beta-lactamase superfamily II metal-dependent hydrolase
VLVHLGDNDWCIVDSCISRNSRESVASEYLRSFENGALGRVRLVIATHWHDDHIRGLASILQESPDAHFGCSAALDNDNFRELVGLGDLFIQRKSGIDEFKAILDLLFKRRTTGTPLRLVAPRFAIENRRLLYLPSSGRTCAASVTAMSPSDGTMKLALADFAQLLPKPGQAQRRIPNRAPNRTSVVLWIEVGTRRALLGADLEHTDHPGEGWVAVLASRQDPTRAQALKVPHHGSVNADCPNVWADMLVRNPIAVVTPFSGGRVHLPRASDLSRLGTRTTSLYCTSEGMGQPPRRDNSVEKIVKRVTKQRRVIDGRPGHVRIRWSATDATGAAAVETFDGAYQVH